LLNILTKTILITLLIGAVLFTNVRLFDRVTAESGVGNDVFKVIVSLYGMSNSTKDVVTLVNVGNQTKVKLLNAENPEGEEEDKVSYTITFPGTVVEDGETYTVCTMTVNNFELDCDKGSNSPLNRPEFVDVNLGGVDSANSTKEADNEDEDD
jgi:hypothetical protein